MTLYSVISLILSVVIAVFTTSFLRLLWILPSIHQRPRSSQKCSAKVVIVLGSGGHTAEMLRLVEHLNFNKYTQRVYIISSGDSLSEGKAQAFELRKQNEEKYKSSFDIVHVPRARRVGQSWVTTPFTSIQSFMGSLRVILTKPLADAVLCNGPGTCVFICMAALIPRFFGVKYIRIIYVESFARVTELSLSGKILVYLADRFFVQWPELAKRYPKSEYFGILV